MLIKGDIEANNNIIISPRKPPYSAKIKNINTNDPSQLGGYVYSPITTNDGNVIMVNQGWIPKEQLESINDDKNSKYSINYEGLITPLKKIPKFVKDAANFDVNSSNIWPFMDDELLHQKFGKSEKNDGDNVDKEKSFIVVDVLEPKNEIGTYPHRIQESDLLMVNIPAMQHTIYVWLMGCTGIASFYYAYYYFKNPRSAKKMNSLLAKDRMRKLNTPRDKQAL